MCTWHVKELKFLEHLISTNDIHMNSKKSEKLWIDEYQKLWKIYYAWSNLSIIIKVTFTITSHRSHHSWTWRENIFHWNDVTQKTFDDVKKFTKAFVRKEFDSNLKRTIKMNISNQAINEILGQQNEHEKWNSITFYFKKPTFVTLNYKKIRSNLYESQKPFILHDNEEVQ